MKNPTQKKKCLPNFDYKMICNLKIMTVAGRWLLLNVLAILFPHYPFKIVPAETVVLCRKQNIAFSLSGCNIRRTVSAGSKNKRTRLYPVYIRNFDIRGYVPYPGAIYMYKIMKLFFFEKSEFKAVLLKLTANDQSDNGFLWCSKYTPLELSTPALACIKS